ncbi:MAG: TetR/AcrR family transcriptional regulator [Nocardioides sp.]|uniref:TetR/AcrR family transcriptional regulator n=1 Tax=Nocardioides sp. TaxID=35761 RepID=UPI0039E3C2FD
MPRARPMSPAERRTALVDATLPLLYVHGRAVTTKQIAEAAGIAEGTIFRVFESKDELVAAAMAKAFEPGELLARLDEVDLDRPLRERLLTLASALQQRLRATFGLMRTMGQFGPPPGAHGEDRKQAMDDVRRRMVAIVEPDAERLTVTPDRLVHLLRLLTFAGSNDQIADGQLLSPAEIVDILLTGVLKGEA